MKPIKGYVVCDENDYLVNQYGINVFMRKPHIPEYALENGVSVIQVEIRPAQKKKRRG